MEEKTNKKWRWGKNRWIVLALIVLGIFGARAFSPIQPHVQLPAEPLTREISIPILGNMALTNTMVAMILADIILIAMALGIRSYVKKANESGSLIPKGFYNVFEMLYEALWNMTEATAGSKWAATIFPYFLTIMLLVLVSNWMELIPGVDTIGLLHHSEHGYSTQTVLGGLTAIVKPEAEHGGYGIYPFVRVLSTDLNFTVALALISVVMTQVVGIRAQGMNYFQKFWNTKTFFSKPMFGLIDWVVGILETVSEISKVLSFSFRLFGNIFAGSVMLFVLGSLVPILVQAGLYGFELFVGTIQAYVFGMLTMVFMAMATKGHGEHEEH
ncbi:MAG: F0F1 ATP synthase subunit A [Anaerolineaceae bacterium]|nr:F0F1 ATP synthase subunit A [Anaerolineaceae bacterium]